MAALIAAISSANAGQQKDAIQLVSNGLCQLDSVLISTSIGNNGLKQLDQASEDAENSLIWPEASLLKIFRLVDGRIALVREASNG